MSILDATWLDLKPTRTFDQRFAFWVPVDLIHGIDDGKHGTVKIQQRKGKRSGCKVEEDVYLVEFHGAVPGAMAYQFIFANTKPDPQEIAAKQDVGPYLVTVGPHIRDCTCKAGKCKTEECKHRATALAILDGDLLDGIHEPHVAAA